VKRLGILGNFRTQHTAEQDWRVAFEAAGWEVVPYQGDRMSARHVLGAARHVDVLLWVTMGRGWPRGLSAQASRFCRTVGWRPDRYWGRERLGEWWRDPLFGCDVVVTTDGYPHDWPSIGVNHHHVMQAVSDRWVRFPGRYRAGLSADVAFIGGLTNYSEPSWRDYRVTLRDRMVTLCDREGWRWRNYGGEHRRVERSERMNHVYRSCEVTVGDSMLFYGDRDRYWSNRVPEALGRGGVLVFPQVDWLAELTDGMLPMWPLNDWDELDRQVSMLMGDEGRRRELRRWGRVWARAHTYEKRVPELEGLF